MLINDNAVMRWSKVGEGTLFLLLQKEEVNKKYTLVGFQYRQRISEGRGGEDRGKYK